MAAWAGPETEFATSGGGRRVTRMRLPVTASAVLESMALTIVILGVALRSVASEDLVLFDETAYLTAGVAARSGDWPGFAAGATYGDLYWLLSFVSPDRIGLYFAGRAAAALLLVLGVWLAARLVAGRNLAWAAAAVVAVSPAPYVWPGVAAPAAAAVLVGLALLLRWPGLPSMSVSAGLFWLAAGSRPELWWWAAATSVVVLAVLFRCLAYRDPRLGVNGVVLAVAGSLGVPALLMWLHGSPLSSNGRDWLAFQQHFSIRNVTEGEDPWFQSASSVARSFPGADNLIEALITNPTAFVGHVAANIRDAPSTLVRDVMPGFGAVSLVAGLALLGGVVLALLVDPPRSARRWRQVRSQLWQPKYRIPFVIAGLLILALVVPVAGIYPRAHYLLIPAGLLLLGLVTLQRHVGSQRLVGILPMSLLALILVLVGLQVVRQVVTRVAYPAPLAATAARMIDSGREWRVLALEPGLDVYVPNAKIISNEALGPQEDFVAYLSRLGITAVFASGNDALAPWAGSPKLEAFLADPSAFGFEELFPGSRMLLKSE